MPWYNRGQYGDTLAGSYDEISQHAYILTGIPYILFILLNLEQVDHPDVRFRGMQPSTQVQ